MHKWIKGAAYFLVAYLVLLVAVIFHPNTLRATVFLHWINWPSASKLAHPVYFGFGVHGARHLFLNTTDGQKIGAWHVLSPTLQALDDAAKEKALREASVVYLYLHGNAANRAAPLRQTFARSLVAKETTAHVLAIDYRGFGDSSGSPSEATVQLDVDAAFAYLLSVLDEPKKIVVLGHSLGTAIATRFLERLTKGRIADPPLALPPAFVAHKTAKRLPRGLVLVAPFTSLAHVAVTYPLVPFLWPLKYLHASSLLDTLTELLSDPFASSRYLGTVPKGLPILIFHGRSDDEIPVGHAYRLFLDACRDKNATENASTKELVFTPRLPMHKSAALVLANAIQDKGISSEPSPVEAATGRKEGETTASEEEETKQEDNVMEEEEADPETRAILESSAYVNVEVMGLEAFAYTLPANSKSQVTLIEPLYAGHNNIAVFELTLNLLTSWTKAYAKASTARH